VPGLGTSFGRGGATTFQQDLVNSDCILIMGSNMAEAHPIGFSWVLRAKERGVPVFHVDPHFSRTSASVNTWIPIRSGSDVVFLGGLINYVLSNERYFAEYVTAYTNAAAIVGEDFRDTEDLAGLFSGYDPDVRAYHPESWQYAVELDPDNPSVTRIKTDPSLQDPRCVFQILKRHFARYTPDLVEEVCGSPRAQFLDLAEALCQNSGRERTSAIVYAVGWTQHSNGVQVIRSAAILQLLLGNLGRPGGGIMAMRGHASIQGSTDVPTLFDLLSGYMPQPSASPLPPDVTANTAMSWLGASDEAKQPNLVEQSLADYIRASGQRTGWWANLPRYIVSLLKAWYGDAAQPENDFLYSHLPKMVGDHSHLAMTFRMVDGGVNGFIVLGQNPAGGSAHGRLQRKALANLDWMVVRDLYLTETADFWRAPTGEVDPKAIKTEMFFLPAAGPGEKEGCFTNTQRLLQWKEKAVDPPDDARSDAWFIHQLAKRLKALYAESTDPRDKPIQDLTWDFDRDHPEPGSRILDEPDIEKVLRELNGFTWPAKQQVKDFTELKADGSTACGSWIYSGVYPADGQNLAARREPGGYPWLNWGWAWPMNRRILYNRASADPDGQPWSERKQYVWWDAQTERWTGVDVPDFPIGKPPTAKAQPGASGLDALSGADPFIMQSDGKGWLYAPRGLKDGPLPTHYEPAESPVGNSLYPRQEGAPAAKYFQNRGDNPLASTGDPRYPYALTTYRLTEHHLSGPMSRWLPWLGELQPALFAEISEELAAERGIKNGEWITLTSERGAIEARALVTARMTPLRIKGRIVHQIGLPFHWGYKGFVVGDIANDLTHLVLEPNVRIMETKAIMVNLLSGRVARRHQPDLRAGKIVGPATPDGENVPERPRRTKPMGVENE